MRYLISIVLVLAVWSGCKGGEGEKCVQSADCAGGLTCYDEEKRCQTPKYIKEMADARIAVIEAQALADEKCSGKFDCIKHGKCTTKDGKCIATSDAD